MLDIKYWAIACVLAFCAGVSITMAIWTGHKGVCKSYDVTATGQTVEICTRITK